jgi:hypothetical protein
MPTVSNVIANPGFELGDTGWTKGSGWNIATSDNPHAGTWVANNDTDITGEEDSEILNENVVPVVAGFSLTASCYVRGTGADGNIGAVLIDWLDGSFVRVSKSQGNSSPNSSPGTYKLSTVTATAPVGAVYARVGAWCKTKTNGSVKVDDFTWSYVNDRTIRLTSPTDGNEFTEGDTVQLRVDIDGTAPAVEEVVYKDGVTELATVDDSPYSFNITTLAIGAHTITAEANLADGSTIVSDPVDITISATVVVPDTREFKASNSYTFLIAKNFSNLGGNIPSTATVTGVEVVIDYKMDVLVRSDDYDIVDPVGSDPNVIFDLVPNGVVEAILLTEDSGDYTAAGSSITGNVEFIRSDFDLMEEGTSEEKKWTVLEGGAKTITVGGETSLFGFTGISAADFIERSLGIRFYPVLLAKPDYADSGDACIRFKIDKLRLRVYFDAGSAEYYFASADKTEVIKGVLVASYADSGDFRTSDAAGVLQLTPDLEVMLGTQTWIGDDWTIHAAYPPTDANQIGTVAAREADDGIGMSYNGLPSATAIVENRSRYQFITANFFAVRELDSIYGAHGLPRAFAYNGDFFYKIHTQEDADKDQPRHVAYHHGHLGLGFDDGRLDLSVIGQPYNYDGAQGASEWSIGDKITGLLPLSGTILGIFGSKSVWGLSGTTVDNFSTQVIAPNIGAIEYTVTDMGFPVYANAYGIYTLSQTQQYGDYLGTPMSQDVSPWLRPRLVRKYTSDKEVVVAWPVRSKNQYRLAFSDGYILSMTLNAGQQAAPTFSFQQYIVYSEEDES